MTVLRSREIPISPSPKPSPKTLITNPIHPSTPSQLQESPISLSHSTTDSVPALTRRRSSRLSSAMKSDNEGTDGFDNIDLGISKGKRKLIPELNSSSCDVKSEFLDKEYLSLRSGKRVSKIDKELCDADGEGRDLIDCEKDAIDRDGNGNVEILELFPRIDEDDSANSKTRFSRREKGKWVVGICKGKRKLIPDLNSPSCDVKSEFLDKEYLSLRSAKRASKTDKEFCDVDEEGRDLIDCEKDAIDRDGNGKVEILELFPRIDEDDSANSKTRFSRREKGKWVVDDLTSGGNDEILSDHLVHDHTAIDESGYDNVEEFGERNLTVEALLSLSDFVRSDALLSIPEVSGTAHLTDDGPESDDNPVARSSSEEEGNGAVYADLRQQMSNWQKEQWLQTARHYARDEDVDNGLSVESEGERDIKDWPGPFSTAMKIARDRTMKGPPVKKSSSQENTIEPVLWIPRKSNDHNCKKSMPPSLRNLCLGILAQNADAICSLDFVPDAFRHRLSRLLCDSRKMNRRFLDLLFHGSPTEVCITDCSWLNEDEFMKSFNGCDPSKLMILQLDQCGRCIIDYVVQSSLAQSPNSLPALESLSLSGACRLSDVGIAALVSSAPALRSINLSQCSFLTSSSIDTLADSLGSTLRELYLRDCQNLVPMRMVSALKKLEHLEVLSLAGIDSICDNFIWEFITARGHHIKELILSDCIELTDKSIKVISETCSTLRAINLMNVSKLSDYALCCLASGCQDLQKLILSRNLFSDEAVAAFVEISGGNLKELSLNSIKKVDRSTAISLASFSKSLVSLDLSWCRKLTDEYLGLIVDNCSSLRVLKLSGCTQVTNIFLDGHSNSELEIIGLKLAPLLKNIKYSDIFQDSRMPSSC